MGSPQAAGLEPLDHFPPLDWRRSSGRRWWRKCGRPLDVRRMRTQPPAPRPACRRSSPKARPPSPGAAAAPDPHGLVLAATRGWESEEQSAWRGHRKAEEQGAGREEQGAEELASRSSRHGKRATGCLWRRTTGRGGARVLADLRRRENRRGPRVSFGWLFMRLRIIKIWIRMDCREK
jgi:hypothetical protein